MSLKELRTIEDLLRHDLEAVREQLSAAVGAVHAGISANQDLDAMHDASKPSEGVYRDMTGMRAGELRGRIETGKLASVQRERLRREEARLLTELERARRDIEREGVRHTVLPILADLPDASACAVRWDDMAGENNIRGCPHCKATVFNVALLDPPQAEALLATRPADKNLFRRPDGTLIAGDCGHAPSRQRFAQAAATVVGVLIGLAAAAGWVLSHVGTTTTVSGTPTLRQWGPSPGSIAPRQLPPITMPRSVRIEDTFSGLGGTRHVSASLERSGTDLRVDMFCWKNVKLPASRMTTVPATSLDAFIGAVLLHRLAHVRAADCTHTDDHPDIMVSLFYPAGPAHHLSIRNCSREWSFDDDPLAGDPRDLNDTYRELTQALGVEACLADAQP